MEEKIMEILAETLGNPELAKTFTGATDIFNEAGLDSIQMTEFILKIEEVLDVQIDFEVFNYTHLASISTFRKFLEEQRSAGKSAEKG